MAQGNSTEHPHTENKGPVTEREAGTHSGAAEKKSTVSGVTHHNQEVGFRARQVREALGMSQAAFGAVIGLAQSHVSEMERGNSGLGGGAMKALALTHKVRLNYLILGEEPMFDESTPEKRLSHNELINITIDNRNADPETLRGNIDRLAREIMVLWEELK